MFNKANWHFGAGDLVLRKTGKTPVTVATLQGIDVDISASTKELMGSNLFAEAVQRTGTKISGKVQSGRFDHRLVSEFLLGAADADVTEGLLVPVQEPITIDADGVTIVAGGATFDMDLGVRDVATGGALKRVTGVPSTGEYAVNEATGEYTFAAADQGDKVLVKYVKRDAARGTTTTIANQMMGDAPTFELVSYDAKGLFLQLYAVQFNKLSLSRKNEDFLVPNLEFAAFADDVRGVGRISGA